MLTLKEHIEIHEAVTHMFADIDDHPFTDEQIDAAEFYELKWNPVSDQTELSIYDGNGATLATAGFSDPDLAIEVVEELFDLDEDDLLSLRNYEWADNFDDRVWDALQDDGTEE